MLLEYLTCVHDFKKNDIFMDTKQQFIDTEPGF